MILRHPILAALAICLAIWGVVELYGQLPGCHEMQTGYGERCEGLAPGGFMGAPQ